MEWIRVSGNDACLRSHGARLRDRGHGLQPMPVVVLLRGKTKPYPFELTAGVSELRSLDVEINASQGLLHQKNYGDVDNGHGSGTGSAPPSLFRAYTLSPFRWPVSHLPVSLFSRVGQAPPKKSLIVICSMREKLQKSATRSFIGNGVKSRH